MNRLLLWKFFAISFSALLPLVNPLGSSLLLLGFVGPVPIGVYRSLARRIAINTFFFFAVVDAIGSAILHFFGISLPIVQVSGGLVIASMGWSLLNQKDTQPSDKKVELTAATNETDELYTSLSAKAFYPFTFPLTVGPGCMVVTLTLSAQAIQPHIACTLIAHAGIMTAALILCALTYLCYANAARITQAIPPTTAHGMLRVIAFFLLCIGVQIFWTGLTTLINQLRVHP